MKLKRSHVDLTRYITVEVALPGVDNDILARVWPEIDNKVFGRVEIPVRQKIIDEMYNTYYIDDVNSNGEPI